MFRFLMGVIVGAATAVWIERARDRGEVDRRLFDAQDRANAVLLESRRVLEEVRRELAAALESTRRSVEEQASRVRRAAEGERE
jgi:hypothetical protein